MTGLARETRDSYNGTPRWALESNHYTSNIVPSVEILPGLSISSPLFPFKLETLAYLHCQVIYSQFGLAIHQNDHQARRRFIEWAQNEIAVVPDFHKRILFSGEAHFWLNGYVNKQNCRIWSEANPQVYVETPVHPEKQTVWKRFKSWWNPSSKTMKATTLQSMVIGIEP
ncbi:uncharacterized protein TNCV_221261 [Trichonephila clavipes]|nr:uncharacterized protein TNCV_221261 [Trichonephila clavipes]